MKSSRFGIEPKDHSVLSSKRHVCEVNRPIWRRGRPLAQPAVKFNLTRMKQLKLRTIRYDRVFCGCHGESDRYTEPSKHSARGEHDAGYNATHPAETSVKMQRQFPHVLLTRNNGPFAPAPGICARFIAHSCKAQHFTTLRFFPMAPFFAAF